MCTIFPFLEQMCAHVTYLLQINKRFIIHDLDNIHSLKKARVVLNSAVFYYSCYIFTFFPMYINEFFFVVAFDTDHWLVHPHPDLRGQKDHLIVFFCCCSEQNLFLFLPHDL